MTNFEREQLINSFSNWINSKVDNEEWTLLAFTVVFKPVDANNSETRWIDEYQNRVLNKFRRLLERNTTNWSNAIPFDKLFYFERFENSKFRLTGSKAPFHIHALLPIPNYQLHRIYSNVTESINKTLEKDLYSIDVVQNVLLEKIKDKNSDIWIRYISKGKDFLS